MDMHPSGNGRWDALSGTAAGVLHAWGIGNSGFHVDSWGGACQPGSERCAWSPDGTYLTGIVTGTDGKEYIRAVNLDGSLRFDWTVIPGF